VQQLVGTGVGLGGQAAGGVVREALCRGVDLAHAVHHGLRQRRAEGVERAQHLQWRAHVRAVEQVG
jgi:hypothetical protein